MTVQPAASRAIAVLQLLCGLLVAAGAEHTISLSRSRNATSLSAWRRSLWQAEGLAAGAPEAQSLLGTDVRYRPGKSLKLERGGWEFVRNRMDIEYTADFALGTPGQRVRLVFDTGSSDLWVAESAFVPGVSKTWRSSGLRQRGVQYGMGDIEGSVGFDTGCLPTMPRHMCVKQQPIILASVTHNLNLTTMDGILGLGFSGLTQAKITFLRNLNSSYEDLSFAFALESGEGSFAVFGERDEVMRIGHATSTPGKPPIIVEVNVTEPPDILAPSRGSEPGWWLIDASAEAIAANPLETRLRSLQRMARPLVVALAIFMCCCGVCCWQYRYSFKRPNCCKRLCRCFGTSLTCCAGLAFGLSIAIILTEVWRSGHFRRDIRAVLDTGTSLLVVPKLDYYCIASAMFGERLDDSCEEAQGALACFCDIADEVRPLRLEIGGVPLVLRAQDMFIPTGASSEGREVCLTGMAPSVFPFWILGDVFLRQVYAVHNFKQRTVSLFLRDSVRVDFWDEAVVLGIRPVALGALGACAFAFVLCAAAGISGALQRDPLAYQALSDAPDLEVEAPRLASARSLWRGASPLAQS